METIYLTIISIPLLYFFFAFTKKFWVKVFLGINVCPVCMAVGSTWLWMLIARWVGVLDIDNFVIAILLGSTVIGMMWKLEVYYKSRNYPKWYIIRLIYMVSAYLLVYWVATQNSDFFISGLIGLLGLILASILFFVFSKTSPMYFSKDITGRIGESENKESNTQSKSDSKSNNNNGNKDSKEDKSKSATKKLDDMFDNCC